MGRENRLLRARVRELEARLAAVDRKGHSPPRALVGFGNENVYHVSTDNQFMNACVRQPLPGIQNIIKAIHADALHPEHRNVLATNARLPFVRVFDPDVGGWTAVPTIDVIVRLVARSIDMMDSFVEDNMDDSHCFNRYAEFCYRYDGDDKRLVRDLARQTKCTLRSLGALNFMSRAAERPSSPTSHDE